MLLNELENKEHKLNRINKWLTSEFGFTVDSATSENLAEVKQELAKVKTNIAESKSFNDTHNDPRYLRTIMMSDAVDIMMEMNQEEYDAKKKAVQDIQMNPHTSKDSELQAEVMRKKAELKDEAKKHGLKEAPVEEDNAFNTAAAQAAVAGKKEFSFNGKTYPVKMDKAAAQKLLDENKSTIKENEQIEGAEVLLAAQAMVDEIAGMAEDVAEMQTAKLFPLVDQIKYNMGADQAANFNNSVKGALQGLLDIMTQTKDAVSDQVAMISGQAPAGDMMDPVEPAPEAMPADMPAEPAPEESPLELGDEEAGAEDSPLGREEK